MLLYFSTKFHQSSQQGTILAVLVFQDSGQAPLHRPPSIGNVSEQGTEIGSLPTGRV